MAHPEKGVQKVYKIIRYHHILWQENKIRIQYRGLTKSQLV